MTAPIPDHGPLVDTHAHLDDRRLRDDLEGVIARARGAGLVQMIAIGTTAEDAASCVEIACATRRLCRRGSPAEPRRRGRAEDWPRIVELVRRPRVVAVGETGLDRYWDRTPFAEQQDWFDRHLALAHEHDLPVVIHCRDCEQDIIRQLERLGRPVHGVLHSFTGTSDHARAFLELGLHISFAGMVTFSNKSLDP